ncbi:MAG: hypothetical protein R3359_09970, partial [Marinirhabdus sp.]|nr:hypothetical protein [Marinirhabdus sp.]
GPPGAPGINILGQVFEVNVDLNANNDFRQLITIPTDIEVFESDAILVYWLEEVAPGNLDVWSPLPQTIYVNDGSFQYTYNHTFVDVLLFLQGDIDLNTLGPEFTNDQIFRIAIVPAEFASEGVSMEYLMEQGIIDTDSIITLGN